MNGGIIVSNAQLNLALLQERFTPVFNKLENVQLESPADHSVKEAWDKDSAWLDAVKGSVGDINIIFVYGFGQGLSIADLIEMYPDRWLFVYEPDVASFHQSITDFDLTAILEWPKLLWLAVGEEQLNLLFSKMSTHFQEELAFVVLRYYLENDTDELQNVRQKFMEHYVTFLTNNNTREHFKTLWLENVLYNITEFSKYPEIYDFKDEFANETAVIVASGPSLQEDVEWLKKIKQHAIVIAAGSSIQAFSKNGIKPHLTTLLDGNEINKQVFDSDIAKQTPLIVVGRGYHEVVADQQSPIIYSILAQDELMRYMLSLEMTTRPYIHSTTTVVGTAIQSAIVMGAKRIILFGQDLSFNNGQYYAPGVNHTKGENISNEDAQKQLKVKNVKGGYNETTLSLMLMKDDIEKLIKAFPDVEFINTTAHGASIEGTSWVSAKQMYEQMSSQHLFDETSFNDMLAQKKPSSWIELSPYEEKLKWLIGLLEKVKEDSVQIKKLLGKGRDYSISKPAKAWDQLAKAEEKWASFTDTEWFNAIFESCIPKAIKEFDKMLPMIINENNIRKKSILMYDHLGALLQAIIEAVPDIISVMNEALARSQNVQTHIQK